jgi:GTP-binding protein HflX
LQQVHAVTETLVSLHCHATPLVNVFNKSDLLSPHAHAGLERQGLGFSDSVIISAVSGEGLARLRQIIARVLPDRRVNLIVEIPYAESRLRSAIYETGVVQEEQFLDSAVRIEALVEPWLAEQLSSYRKPAAEELEFAPGIDKRMMTPYTQKQ